MLVPIRLFSTFVVFIFVSLASAIASVPPSDQAVRWSFESSAADEVGDTSLDGMLLGDASFASADPIQGSYLSFDGDGDYVDIGGQLLADFDADYTVSAWFRVAVVPEGGERFFVYETAGDFVISLGLREGSDTSKTNLQFFTHTADASPRIDFELPDDQVTGQWIHAAVSYQNNGSGRSMRAYVNGVQRGFLGSDELTTAPNSTPQGFHIGTYRSANGRWFNGDIDEVSVWDRQLSAREIARLADVRPPPRSAIIGIDTFDYPDGAIAGKAGGSFWDWQNLAADPRHTGVASSWTAELGSPLVEGGKLVTDSSSTLRIYNGEDERAGAVNTVENFRQVYYRVEVKRDPGSSAVGLSTYDFGAERIFFGVPAGIPAGEPQLFGFDETGVAVQRSEREAKEEKTYVLVAKLDFDADLLSLWVDPDLSRSESENPPLVTREYTGTNWSTAIRLFSIGRVSWDNLVVAAGPEGWTAIDEALQTGFRSAFAIEHKLGAGGIDDHDSYFEEGGNAIRLTDGSIVVTYQARDNNSVVPASPDGGGYGAFFRVYSPDGTPRHTAPRIPYSDINPAGTGWQSGLVATALADGGFALAWSSSGGPGDVGGGTGFSADGDTYARVFEADGRPRAVTVKVNETEPTGTDDDQSPRALVALAGGGFAVLYDDANNNTGNSADFYVRSFSAAGGPAGPSAELGGGAHQAFFQDFSAEGGLVALDDGGFAACWRTRDDGPDPSPDGAGYGVFVEMFAASGASRFPAIFPYNDLNPAGQGNQNRPKLAALADGLAVVWNSVGGDGDVGESFSEFRGGDSYLRVFDISDGSPRGGSVKVNDLSEAFLDTPEALVALENGNLAVAWTEDDEQIDAATDGPNRDDHFVRVFSPAGAPLGASTRLGGGIQDDLLQDFGNLIPLADGGFAACWTTRDSENNGTGISADGDGWAAFIRVFDGFGADVSGLVTPYADLNPGGLGSQSLIRLAPLERGGFAAAWNSTYGPGDRGTGPNGTSGGDTYARHFDRNGAPRSATRRAHFREPTGCPDEQFPVSIVEGQGSFAVVVRDQNDNTDNKDDLFIRFFVGEQVGDFTGDSVVDVRDAGWLRSRLLAGTTDLELDYNGDGSLNISDELQLLVDLEADAISVTSTADDGPGSLRQVLADACVGGTTIIGLGPGVAGETLVLSSGELVIDGRKDIYLAKPPGPDTQLTIDAGYHSRGLRIAEGSAVALHGITITRGQSDAGADGGAILNEGSLLLSNAIIRDSHTGDGEDGAVGTLSSDGIDGESGGAGEDGGDGGGIASSGSLYLVDSLIENNSTGQGGAGGNGGSTGAPFGFSGRGGHAGDGGKGGGIHATGPVTIENCTLSANRTGGGGIAGDAGSASPAAGSGGRGGNGGNGGAGGALNADFPAVLTRCTVIENQTGAGTFGGVGGEGASDGSAGSNGDPGAGGAVAGGVGTLIRHCTFDRNRTTPGGEGGTLAIADGGVFFLSHSIVANRPDVGPGGEIFGQFGGDSNLITDLPRLLPLGDYGGATPTMPPFPGSPAIDGAPTSGSTADQRGFAISDGAPDIGAVEFRGAPDLALVWETDADHDGRGWGLEFALGTDPNVADESSTPKFSIDATGGLRLELGVNADAIGHATWLVERSINLADWETVYRSGAPASGVDEPTIFNFAEITADGVTLIKTSGLGDRAFLRFVAEIRGPTAPAR